MYQYSRIFGTARVPTENGCHIGQDPNSKHMVVLCRGQFYWFDVLDDNSDLIMTEKDLALNLQVINDDAEQIPIQEAAKGSIGVLTTENRKVWASLRDVLTTDPESNNADCLGIVDAALFILCLDYTSPTTGADLCTNMLCGTSEVVRGVQVGTCTNRWYDKLQIIVCKNGSAGINFEHTGVDGHTVLRMASDVYTDTILRFARTINGQAPSLWASTSPDPSKRDPASFGDVSTTPHKLEWDMVPSVTTALRFAETRLADLIQQNEFQTLDFAGYGKNFMTSMGFSPDAFVQMAFQAAYYGLYGRLECTYEPAMTKLFLHGRTEAIRTVTPEVADFVQLFWGEHPPAEKIDALRKACQKHTAITKNCAKALGQDRHLYALYCVWQRGLDDEGVETSPSSSARSSRPASSSPPPPDPTLKDELALARPSPPSPPPNRIPAIFADAGWSKINNTILSTSNCGNPSLRHFGFGPTSADGFGIGYIIKDECVSICASSKHRQTKRFVESIEGVFLETRKLLRAIKKRGASGSGAKMTRAREIEEQRERSKKVRGREVHANRQPAKQPDGEDVSPEEESDEDGLGGCECPLLSRSPEFARAIADRPTHLDGFFDAGMLKQALKSGADSERKKGDGERAVESLRRNVGKKLRLTEY
jgi:carnitine O-acetyltransferase